ncbi:hypothetical protein HK097_004899 [Rhizophlyctis rosea]|uniref:Survival Motor Neuron Gemin2-binding domain-containing protein n=1 Tax=Rhizophlyctis rosea TaxID=64517 RepID=A0AAD5SDS0_9FUNG|nr:hypothetical protein HK097_004899 [Rhizophlyctis rosea]
MSNEDMEYEEGELEDDHEPYQAEEGVWKDAGADTEEIDFNEKWDDTALIEAWDSAVREYQRYHSGKVTHTENTTKRRRIKKQTEVDGSQLLERSHYDESISTPEAQYKEDAGPSKAASDHVPVRPELHPSPCPRYGLIDLQQDWTGHAPNNDHQHAAWNTDSIPPEHRCTSCNGPRFAALAGMVALCFVVPPSAYLTKHLDDEDLTNMMMAWYYAGYYTSIYNAKRKCEA